MRLQVKLSVAFGALAAIMLAISLLALWQVERLGSALYEIGSVRLPSLRGLAQMAAAAAELDRSAQAVANDADAARSGMEAARQRQAWADFDAGRKTYEPLPQTPEEAELWRVFVPAARAWQSEFSSVLAALHSARTEGDRAALTAARARLEQARTGALAEVQSLLDRLTQLNYRVAEDARQHSIAGRQDMERTRRLMVASAVLGVCSALAFGYLIGRRLSRPVATMADALTRVAAGDRQVQVELHSYDEVRQMGHALNRMVEALRVNESRVRLLGDSLPDAMLYQVARGRDGIVRFQHVSAGVERLHGVTAEAVLRDPALLYGQFIEEDRARVAAAEQASQATMTIFRVEARIRRPDGALRWVHLCSQPRSAPDGAVVWDGIELDITERKQAGDELARVNRALRAISRTNHALVHARDETTLLHEVCRIAVEDGGYRLAWVGFAERDPERTVRPVAVWGAGEAADYVAGLQVSWADNPRGRGPTGIAIRTGQPATNPEFHRNLDVAPWREAAQHHGLASSLALPLFVDGAVLGALSIYASDPEAFGPEAMALLRELADDLAYGIQTLRTRQRQAESEAEVRRLLADADRTRQTLLSIIEDRQQALDALRLSEERFRSAMEHSGIGMALVAPDGRWLEINPAFCAIVGYTREELLGMKFQDLTHPDDHAEDQQRLRRLLAGEVPAATFEKRYLHKSGRILWINLTTSLLRDATGAPLHFVSQFQDITARKQAEATVAATAERLAVALRASGFGIWRHNLQTGETEWDSRMFELFGLPPGRSPTPGAILDCIAAEDRVSVERSWRALPSCDHNYHQQFRVVRPDGSERHLELHGLVRDDALGRPEWSIGVAGDITGIVTSAAESAALRTQLQQAQKMETLGKLAAGVAHDFNNILTGISGFIELASNSLGPGHEATDLLKQARRGALSARDLVRRILTFSRSNREQKRSRLDLVEVVRDTAPLLTAALPSHVSLSLAFQCETAPVLADSGQMQQILMNLCINAAHAIGTQAGRIQIGVALADFTTGGSTPIPPGCVAGRYVRLSVRDNGCGMDEATRQRLFEPFFTTKRPGEGTGLGLAIVQNIVATNEGGIQVQSAPGAGTTFALFLPVATSEAAPVAAPATTAAPRGTGQRIAVVDDEPSVATVVRLTLQRHGYAPEVFASPVSAWNRLEAAPMEFDLLIVDQNMPEMTGVELVRRTRRVAPDLPIVIMSGRFESVVELVMMESPRIFSLKKPFEIAELLTGIKTALASNPPRPPPA